MAPVSVLLPTFNGVRTIERAIRSVLSQTYGDFELLVIDDASRDDTIALCESIASGDRRLRIITNQTNVHITASLNRGLVESVGEFIARIDDDDEWCDAMKLEKQMGELIADPRLGLVGTWAMIVDCDGQTVGAARPPLSDAEIRHRFLGSNCFIHSSVVFRRAAAGNGYCLDAQTVEDYELWLRIGAMWRLANVPSFSVRYKISPDGISQRSWYRQKWQSIRIAWKHRKTYPRCIQGLAWRALDYPLPPDAAAAMGRTLRSVFGGHAEAESPNRDEEQGLD